MNVKEMCVFSICFYILGYTLVEAYKDCKNVPDTDVDESWLRKVGQGGLYVVSISNCLNCDHEEPWAWMRGRVIPKRICWTAEVKVPGEDVTSFLNFDCTYTYISKQNCELSTDRKNLGLKGALTYAVTDNSTYIAGQFCVFGKEETWFIIATTPTIDSSTHSNILFQLSKLGLDVNNIATSDTTFIKKYTIKDC